MSIICTPKNGRSTFPFCSSWSTIGSTSLLGIANPSDSTPLSLTFKLLMPMTWPLALINGPPLFPGLIAASVCSTFISTVPCVVSTSIVRFSPLMMPCVTVPENCCPSGLPIAITFSPVRSCEESPKLATFLTFLLLISKTAKSVMVSLPTSLAVSVSPLYSVIVSCSRLQRHGCL